MQSSQSPGHLELGQLKDSTPLRDSVTYRGQKATGHEITGSLRLSTDLGSEQCPPSRVVERRNQHKTRPALTVVTGTGLEPHRYLLHRAGDAPHDPRTTGFIPTLRTEQPGPAGVWGLTVTELSEKIHSLWILLQLLELRQGQMLLGPQGPWHLPVTGRA